MPRRFIAPKFIKKNYETRIRDIRRRERQHIATINAFTEQFERNNLIARQRIANDDEVTLHQPIRPLQNPNHIIARPINNITINSPFTFVPSHQNSAEMLINKINSATACYNIQIDYCLALLKELVKICPYCFFGIEEEKILRLQWEGNQYSDIVESIKCEAIKEIHFWYPNNVYERNAIKYFIKLMTEKLNRIVRSEIELFTCFERETIGIKNSYQFEDLKKEIGEVLDCIVEANLNFNCFPFNTGIIAEWIVVNKRLKAPLFKILACALAVVDTSDFILKRARENLDEIKKEEPENQWAEIIDEDTTELSQIVEVPNYMDYLDLNADEEGCKAFDALFLASQKKK